MAEVFDLPVQIPFITESTSLGGAFCALVVLREYASLAEAAHALVRWRRTEEPHAGNVERYRDARQNAKNVLDRIMEWIKSGRVEAGWRAPGCYAK